MPDYSVVYQKNFKKEDFQAAPKVFTIKGSELQEFKRDGGKPETKVRLFVLEDERAIVLNNTRWNDVVAIAGSKESEKWVGTKIEVYFDPTVRNPSGGPRGGIGIRKPA